MPEMLTKPIFSSEVKEACGIDEEESSSQEEFESASLEELNPVMSFVLEATDEDQSETETKIVEFLESSVDGDLERFNELLNSFDGSGKLFYLDYPQTYSRNAFLCLDLLMKNTKQLVRISMAAGLRKNCR